MRGMNRKCRIKLIAAAVFAAVFMTGCAEDAIPEMNEEQQKMIGEFAAITLLKYDANNRSRLVDRKFVRGLDPVEEVIPEEKPVEEEPEEKKQDTPVSGQDTPAIDKTEENTEPQNKNIAEFLGLPSGVTITFTGIEFMDSYMPAGLDSSFFALDASEGKTLAVFDFELANNSGEDQEINILSMNPVFKAVFENAGTKNILATLLETDLSTYRNTLKAGESQSVVLLSEIERGTEAGSVSLLVRYNGESDTFSLNP